MPKYTVHQAKTNLSRLLKEATEGKEVIIARGQQEIVRLVPIGNGRKKRVPGRFAGQFWCSDDAFAPLTDQEMHDLGFE